MEKKKIPANEFKLAITMAGAISAGCYTAGVMDYLYEMLEVWEKAREGDFSTFEVYKTVGDADPGPDYSSYIPPHRVVIEAMGGASAGAMTTTMSAIYALNGEITPVRSPVEGSKKLTGNLLYDKWVVMNDDDVKKGNNTFSSLWDLDDLKDGKLKSALNSQFVDNIAEAAFTNPGKDISTAVKQLRPYVSKDLQMILSHCLLRGMPLDVDFQTPIARLGRKSVIPNHTTYEHYIISHYHLNKGEKPNVSEYLFLNPYEAPYKDTMKLATMATGAFPVGLSYREFDQNSLNDKYLHTAFKRIITGNFGLADPDPDKHIKLKYFPKEFSSVTVDGGAINNEPYREVLGILKDVYGEPEDDSFPAYGVVMIDPFPDRAQTQPPYDKPKDLLDVLPGILGTLTDQSRVKRREMLESDPDKYYRCIIFPRRWNRNDKSIKPDKMPIACASVYAFGGFMDISFREHDFFLGRHNARNFIRYFFSMPYEPRSEGKPAKIHPIHKDWSPELIEQFKIVKDGKLYLPIIPDLSMLFESTQRREDKIYEYAMDKPKIDPSRLYAQRSRIKKRLVTLFDVLKARRNNVSETEIDVKATDATNWIQSYFKSSWLSWLAGGITSIIINIGYSLSKGSVAGKLTKAIIKTVIVDLDKNGLLKPYKKNRHRWW